MELKTLCFSNVTLWVGSVSLCGGASQRIPFSVLVRNPHKELGREISHETGSGREKKGPGEGPKDTVRRREQKGPVDRTDQSGR